MLYTLVDVYKTILHSFFFYDIIIVGRHGHLFQNRYKSIVGDEDSYFRELVHPVPATTVKNIGSHAVKKVYKIVWPFFVCDKIVLW